MNTKQVRVRFAPSPTGHLHIGGIRTALFNWLFARNKKGIFVLRIEDTDRERSSEKFTREIIESLEWLGLHWDEGPYHQSERTSLYKSAIEKLIEEDNAYYCYCSPEELDARRKEAMANRQPVRYNRKCRDLMSPPPGRKPVIRIKAPLEGSITAHDLLRGDITFDSDQLDDLIIARSDGTPTYNLVVVVDDADMNITHVIRGDDHLSNTPRQLVIYRALGHIPPVFTHIPLIHGSDRAKLSKRHGALSVLEYREKGYLPDALVNYLARLGWSYGDQEIFTREELIQYFSLENLNKSAAVFNAEKLEWLNSQYIQQSEPRCLIAPFREQLIKSRGFTTASLPLDTRIEEVIRLHQQRSRTIVEMVEQTGYFFTEDFEYEPKAREKFEHPENVPIFEDLISEFRDVNDFSESVLESILAAYVEKKGMGFGKIAQPIRCAVTGRPASPGLFETLAVIGKDSTIRRLERALTCIKENT